MKKRNKFPLSYYNLLSCNMGELVPIGLTEVLPGDTLQHATSALVRMSPLIRPVMHPIEVRIHHWYVPHRLVWDDFEKFITGGEDGNDASEFPYIDVGGSGASVGSLFDYLGVPTGVANLEVSALPIRGYDLIFNEFYRDQDLVTALTIDTTSGEDTTSATALQMAAWEKDYFTSARPTEQKGADVTIPIGTSAPVVTDAAENATLGIFSTVEDEYRAIRESTSNVRFEATTSTEGNSLYTDLSAATGISANALREAFAKQRFKEMRSRFGSRYTEYLRALGIQSSDGRLGRPEYLGGGKQTLQISEVLQTAGTTDGSQTGVGDLKGHGIGALRSNRYRRFFEEHGYVHSFMVIRPKTMYMDGLARHWNRRTKEDFWQPELESIGQQAILNKELKAGHATPDGTFGYQDRYDEYRRQENGVRGEFRESTLYDWHLARDLSSGDPALNSTFVTSNPTNRIFASTSTDTIWVMANHSIQARRMVAKMARNRLF